MVIWVVGGGGDDVNVMQVFAKNMEKAVIETVEAGHMTKDLAICVHGWNVSEDQYLMTEPFMDEIKVNVF